MALTAYSGELPRRARAQRVRGRGALRARLRGAEPVAQQSRLRDARHHLGQRRPRSTSRASRSIQDGVSISKSRGSYVELFDIERVEIARGPQSTLYGRGALIGAVNIIQNRADPRGFAGFFEAGYGNFDYWSRGRHAERAAGRHAPPSASRAATATATASSPICSAARISTRSTPARSAAPSISRRASGSASTSSAITRRTIRPAPRSSR